MFGGVLLAGRCLSFRNVEGATGQGASFASTSGPPLHLLQRRTAAALIEALAKNKKRGLGVGIQVYGSQTLFIVLLRYVV